MKKDIVRIQIILLCLLVACIIGAIHTGYAQQIRWLSVTSLQSPTNEIGAEYENEFPTGNSNFFLGLLSTVSVRIRVAPGVCGSAA
jgi:ABC-type molybdate transport system substrate-binding protein